MTDGFSEYKLIQKKLEIVESDIVKIRQEFDSLQLGHRDNRIDIDKLVMILIGDNEIGLVGLLERFKSIEERLLLGRRNQYIINISTFLLTLGVFIYLVMRLGI